MSAHRQQSSVAQGIPSRAIRLRWPCSTPSLARTPAAEFRIRTATITIETKKLLPIDFFELFLTPNTSDEVDLQDYFSVEDTILLEVTHVPRDADLVGMVRGTLSGNANIGNIVAQHSRSTVALQINIALSAHSIVQVCKCVTLANRSEAVSFHSSPSLDSVLRWLAAHCAETLKRIMLRKPPSPSTLLRLLTRIIVNKLRSARGARHI